MEKSEENKWQNTFLVFILLIWVSTWIIGTQFYFHEVKPYNNGYQYISTNNTRYPPKYQSIAIDRYKMEYIPDHPLSGENILILINIDYLDRNVSCADCVINADYTTDEGMKYTLLKNSMIGDEGVKFTYPGKQVEVVMEHENSTYKFFIPLPSKKQSLILALEDTPWIRIILPLWGLSTIILGILIFLQRKIYRQNLRKFIEELKKEIRKGKKKK